MFNKVETSIENLITNNQNSKKLLIFVSSKEFFKSNFWLNPKLYLKEFDSCCINYSSLYFKLYSLKFDFFFSIDDDIFEDVRKIFHEEKSKPIFLNPNSYYQSLTEIKDLTRKMGDLSKGDNCGFNSGTACLREFMKLNVYDEIHLIGFNLILSSGNITKRKRKFMPEKKGTQIQKFKDSAKIASIILNHYPQVKVYKTYEKSNIAGLESSDIFHTLDKKIININRKFKSIL